MVKCVRLLRSPNFLKDVLDVDLQVGGTNSIIGEYQLRKAVACLAV